MTYLTCEQFFDGEHLHGPSQLTVENGVVLAIQPHSGPTEFHVISPGFVDIQMNGFDKWDVSVCESSDLQSLDASLTALGTTTWLATIVTAPLDRLSTSLHRLSTAIESGLVTGCAGVHVEGPFLGRSPGAHNPKWIVPFDLKWIQELPSSVRVVTIAAEQEDAARAIELMRKKNITVSLGHSQPNRSQFETCVNSGASLVTHLFNGMSGVHHRNDGLALMALTSDSVKAGLIADLVHCSPAAINLAFRAKNPDGVVLVSDSVAWQSEWALQRGVKVVDGSPRLPDGTLAGSSTPLAQCVANAVNVAGVSLTDALRAATSTPALAVGLSTVGRIRVGEPADIVALDSALSVVRAWRRLPSECA